MIQKIKAVLYPLNCVCQGLQYIALENTVVK